MDPRTTSIILSKYVDTLSSADNVDEGGSYLLLIQQSNNDNSSKDDSQSSIFWPHCPNALFTTIEIVFFSGRQRCLHVSPEACFYSKAGWPMQHRKNTVIDDSPHSCSVDDSRYSSISFRNSYVERSSASKSSISSYFLSCSL